MRQKTISVAVLGAMWALGLVLPHYQPDPNLFELLLSSAVVILLPISL